MLVLENNMLVPLQLKLRNRGWISKFCDYFILFEKKDKRKKLFIDDCNNFCFMTTMRGFKETYVGSGCIVDGEFGLYGLTAAHK